MNESKYKLVAIFGDQAAGFIQQSIQRVFEVASQGNFKLAYFLLRLFVLVNPAEIRSVVLNAMDEAKERAEEVRMQYISSHEQDIRIGIATRSEVFAAAEQEYFRVRLEAGLEALGDTYARYRTLFKPYNEEVV